MVIVFTLVLNSILVGVPLMFVIKQESDMIERLSTHTTLGSLEAQVVTNPSATQETWVWSLGCEDPLEKGMATHSRIFTWRIPWTEDPGRLYSPWGHRESDVTKHTLNRMVAWRLGSL